MNGEEKYAFEKYKKRNNIYSESAIDKMFAGRSAIKDLCSKLDNKEIKDKDFIKGVMQAVDWRG